MMAGNSLEVLGTTAFFSSNILISETPKQPIFPILPIQTPSLVKPSILSTPPLQTHSPFRQIFLLTITKSSSASSISANKPHLSTQPHTRCQTPTPGKYRTSSSPTHSSQLPKFCSFTHFLHIQDFISQCREEKNSASRHSTWLFFWQINTAANGFYFSSLTPCSLSFKDLLIWTK